MNPEQYLLDLVREALDELETREAPLSASIRKAIRIARLREDWLNLFWLKWEMISIVSDSERKASVGEVLPHLSKDQYAFFRTRNVMAWTSERDSASVDEKLKITRGDNILAKSVEEIEVLQEYYENMAEDATTPPGLHPLDAYFVNKEAGDLKFMARIMSSECQAIQSRIRNRVHDHLGQVESQLVFGQMYADPFERNRKFVIERLGQIAPEALEKFIAAYEAIEENSPESWSQALLTCRRLLKALADSLQPATGETKTGADGIEREITDENYINRLWQFASDASAGSRSGDLLLEEVTDLGNRIDRLYELINKGVHADLSELEVTQALLQVYVVVGDLLRHEQKISAMNVPDEDVDIPSSAA